MITASIMTSLEMTIVPARKASKSAGTVLGCLLVVLVSSCSPREMNMTEFSRLPPFKGKVAKVERISSKNPPRSVSGPDYRVTVIKADGSTIVISRIETYSWTAIRLEQLMEKPECDLPDEIVQCADRHGGTAD
jgi:hypothetical protein